MMKNLYELVEQYL